MINFELVKVYSWEDISGTIAERVGADDLSDKEVNEEYQNFWHVALDCFIPDGMSNESTVTLYGIEDWEDSKEYYLEQHGKWTEPFFQAYCDIMQELDPDFNGIQVKFSW